MATMLVAYDLNRPHQDYANLYRRLEQVGSNWWHQLDSTWLIKTTLPEDQLRDELRRHIDADDELLIIDVTSRPWAAAGFNSYDWLHEYL